MAPRRSGATPSSARRRTAREETLDARRALYRDRVLRAAGDAFAKRGVPHTRMEELADRAGISLGTLYSVYKGKAEIVDALHESRLREIHAASIEAEAAEHAPLEALLAGSRAYITYFLAHPDYLRMYLDEGSSWGVRDSMGRESRRGVVWDDGVRQLAEIFARGIEAGVFEPGPPDRLARMMLAMQQVQLADWIEDGMTASAEAIMDEAEILIRRAFCTPAFRRRGARRDDPDASEPG